MDAGSIAFEVIGHPKRRRTLLFRAPDSGALYRINQY